MAGMTPDPRRHRVPSPPRRLLEALALKCGWIDWEKSLARQKPDGAAAIGGAPRVLLRVDEFPHARAFDPAGRFGTDAFRRFHSVLAEAGIPYLLAITPRVSRDYLDPAIKESRPLEEAEIEQLRALRDEGVAFALHGLDHRTRHASPRRHSELCGLAREALARRLDLALQTFGELDLRTPVFVPPFNRFDAAQYPLLAERFAVVCGGPESVRLVGFGPTPTRWDGAVYLPSYPPLYGRADEVAAGIERLVARGATPWAPATLHWGWELEDDFVALRRLCATLTGRAARWGEFLDAVESHRVV